ncbi:hypothetical protein HOLleu_44306 [Holothuria leucospilota]|uniref:Uncharacterized protein n=1 Tax=Holothuria leucospilota TaxID=206669 RepID=A0A9Q0Y9R5_HOLLE|nr:hypothetical protein HOLleu_44306 [Holothuria leucospilota]
MSPEVKKQNIPRLSYGVTRGQKAKYPKNSQDCNLASLGSKINISQEFPRSSSGVIRGQKAKAKFPKNSQGCYMGSPEVKKQNIPRS